EVLPRLDLRTTGMEFASEMVIRASKEKLRIAEFPIEYHPRGGESKLSSFRDGWRHLRFLLVGLVLGGIIVGTWISHGFGSLADEHLAVVAATFVIVGIQIFFSSFLLCILGLRRR